ncbi:MAG TPA: ATP-binding cassette domain-containing protein [Egibacteraceae bacterium]|nr:ATP-binding cassette domain-containing protein [Egibacteraceae bacterium]
MAELSVRDLTVEYSSGGYMARPIDGLDLDVSPGELVLLLGASGSGKTTLLSVLARILTPKTGTVRLGDTVVSELEGPALVHYRRHTVGIVFQAFNLVPSLSAAENVQVPLRLAGARAGPARARTEELLGRMGLQDRMRHRPGDLSGGQQQRVAIARALAHEPVLVLADEPTAHLDYIQVEGVLRLLREVAGGGRIVVVASHDERMLPLADRIVELTPRRSPAEVAVPPRLQVAPGQEVFAQGDAGDFVYVVEEGEVDLVRVRFDGGDELVARMEPGRYFGELAPLFGLRRSATARAATAAVVQGLTVAEFRRRTGEGGVRQALAGGQG